MLRAGGYFAWAAQPVYKHEEAQQEAWKGIASCYYVVHLFLQGYNIPMCQITLLLFFHMRNPYPFIC